MLQTIHHRTRYIYDTPQLRVTQSLRLTPSVCKSQRTQNWEINVTGARLGASFRDGAGDQVTTLTLLGPISEIELQVSGTVETTDTSGILQGLRETVSPLVYLRGSDLTALDDSLWTLARDVASGKNAGSLELAHALCLEIGAAIKYRPGATHHHITAAQALQQGAGVCQDHTHALIAVARANGYPARYVVGYLQSDAEGKSHGASHAWAEIYIEALGWVGFDATNNCCPDERYVRLCSGLDAHDAAPIRGVAVGAGEETMDVSVQIGMGQQ